MSQRINPLVLRVALLAPKAASVGNAGAERNWVRPEVCISLHLLLHQDSAGDLGGTLVQCTVNTFPGEVMFEVLKV